MPSSASQLSAALESIAHQQKRASQQTVFFGGCHSYNPIQGCPRCSLIFPIILSNFHRKELHLQPHICVFQRAGQRTDISLFGHLHQPRKCLSPRSYHGQSHLKVIQSPTTRLSISVPEMPNKCSSRQRVFDLLWKQYFRDPSQWWDYRRNKKGPGSPDFKHKHSKEPLWIDGRDNPAWVGDELRRRGLFQVQEDVRLCRNDIGKTIQDNDTDTGESISFVSLLRICAKNKDLYRGIRVHDDVLKKGLLEKCSDALITMYAKCGELAKAKELLDVHNSKDLISWTALIAGYAKQGQNKNALSCFEQMQQKGLSPDAVAYAYILRVCASLEDLDKGEHLHNEIAKGGLLQNDVMLGTALVDMYAKCGALMKAEQALENLSVRNVFTWTALIAGYAHREQSQDALRCFERMLQEGHSPDEVTYACILTACGNLRAIDKGEEIHDEIVRQGLLRRNVVLGTALVDMYAKCGNLAKAHRVLEKLPARDVVAWNALIAGYAQECQGEQALDCFDMMQKEGLSPNAVTFACILKACGTIGALWQGEEIHDKIVAQGLLENNIMLCTALVDMYARCGALIKAQQTLEELPSRGVATWNALITGYAQQGQSKQALNCLKCMEDEGFSPNAVTFSSVLNACSHLGLLEEGQMFFRNMSQEYGVEPALEHYTCMIDLFGRAGHLDKAVELIKLMPSSEHSVVWHALLGSCRKWKDVVVGRWAFQNAVRIDKNDPVPYLLMYNIFAALGMQEDADTVEVMRVENKAWKMPGCSWWVDNSGIIHNFKVGDMKHAQRKGIYAKLEDLANKLLEEGYTPNLEWVSSNTCDDAKKDLLCGHSEKLALACALINTSQGETIRILKNLRVCGDCHNATALISKIEKRKIVIRDANLCHDFEDGKCSCKEYW